MTLEELFAYAKDQTVLKRVTAAVYKVALQVWGETIGDRTETVFQKRAQHAYRLIQQGETYISQWALMLVTAGRLTPLTNDEELEALVVEFWDQFSGVTERDREPPPAQES